MLDSASHWIGIIGAAPHSAMSTEHFLPDVWSLMLFVPHWIAISDATTKSAMPAVHLLPDGWPLILYLNGLS